ncbi:MAG: ATP-binding protein [Nitrososphaerota archaeon]|nr:ATP-binding protein [Nitrososphaerota archaeon]
MNIQSALVRYMGIQPPEGMVEREIRVEPGEFIASIIGPRRAGKTTFMLQLMRDSKLPESNRVFINGEDINLEGVSTADLEQIEQEVFRIYRPESSKKVGLFIDEVQNFPSWERWVRTLHDSRRYEIVISGSTSELSSENIPSAMRGRALNTLVLPFSFSEFLSAKRFKPQEFMGPEKAGQVLALCDEFLKFGGYPAVVTSREEGTKLRVLQEIYSSVVQRDIAERLSVRGRAVLGEFVNALIAGACRPFSASAAAKWFGSLGVKLSRQTALNYARAAESVFLVFYLPACSRKPKERMSRPKLYVADSGLLELIGADESKKLENQVCIELLRRGLKPCYWRAGSSGREVDFVIPGKNSRVPPALLQVAYSLAEPSTYERETRALLDASEELGSVELAIVTHSEEREVVEKGKRIAVLPAWKWFLSKGSGAGETGARDTHGGAQIEI